jgi:N-methylhydantoinase B
VTTTARSGLRLDPRTFEIIRHRLWYINDEGALTISRVSGSPVATEVFDMNTGLMTAAGELVYIDNFICAQATTLASLVAHLQDGYGENPGFYPGDVFLCNDPYVSVCHQTCVQVTTPIFHGEELVAWAGASLHAIDTGGPTAGQVQLDAADIHGEQPLFGPIKVVERGQFRRDVESTYLKNSRLPDLLALDLRAKVAAVDVIRRRMDEAFAEFGAETVLAGMADVIDYTELRLRARLRELPDGVWRHRGYIELGDDIYACQVTMSKRDDRLIFDFTGTDEQAPAVINCTVHGLRGGVLAAVLVYLCWDIPWSPAAVSRIIEVISRPGTLVHAQWPAGVSKSTTTGIWEVRNLASITIGKMLAASERHRERAMAGWQGTKALEELFGSDAQGRRFGGPLLDGMAGGSGATPVRDGIDTGGHTSSLRATIANVESYEFRYPLLYLYRRQARDSGGPGKFRGGAGVTMMYTAHGTPAIDTKILHTFGVEAPESPGLCGGLPSATNQFAILRDSDVRERFARGEMPGELAEIEGRLEIYGAYAATAMTDEDVYRTLSMGGGGYGDPIDRDPALVREDVERLLVSVEWADRVYGVVIREGAVDREATLARRESIRAERRAGASAPSLGGLGHAGGSWDAEAEGVRLGEELFYDLRGGQPRYRTGCGYVLGPASHAWQELVPVAHHPVQCIGPEVNPHGVGGRRFELRELYCPGCFTLLGVEIARPEDPILADGMLIPEAIGSGKQL